MANVRSSGYDQQLHVYKELVLNPYPANVENRVRS